MPNNKEVKENKMFDTSKDCNEQSKSSKPKQHGGKSDRRDDSNRNKFTRLIKSDQHPSWYVANDRDLRNMFSVPFSERVGDPLDVQLNLLNKSMPGIAYFDYFPALGNHTDRTSVLNKAADTIYAYIYQGYTQNPSFEAPDLLMYMVSVADLIANIAEMKRAYGILFKYSNFNKYFGEALFNSYFNVNDGEIGSYSDAIENLAQIRTKLNLIMEQVKSSFRIPAGFPLVDRWKYLTSVILSDGDGDKSQIYMYRKAGDLIYDSTTYQTGTSIQLVTRGHEYTDAQGTALKGWRKLFAVITAQIKALQGDTDVNNMSGAILRVYGEGNLMKFTPLEEKYTIDFSYDEIELHQLHNIEPIGVGTDQPIHAAYAYKNPTDGTFSVVDMERNTAAPLVGFIIQLDDGTIFTSPKVVANTTGDTAVLFPRQYNHILDIHSDVPGPVDVLESTRGKAGFESSTDSVSVPSLVCGSEIWMDCVFVRYRRGSDLMQSFMNYYTWMNTTTDPDNGLHVVEVTSKFDWFPCYVLVKATEGKFDINSEAMFIGEIYNYTFLSNNDLCDMNRRVFWQLLNLPANIKSVTGNK